MASGFIFIVGTNGNDSENVQRTRLRIQMQGNARKGKHDHDADAFFDAAKYGGDVFVTNDNRFQKLRGIGDIDVIAPTGMMRALEADSWEV